MVSVCVSISFISLLFRSSDTCLFSRKHCTLPTKLEMNKLATNYFLFLCINLLKMSCAKRWKWHFQDPKYEGAYVHLQNLTLPHWN